MAAVVAPAFAWLGRTRGRYGWRKARDPRIAAAEAAADDAIVAAAAQLERRLILEQTVKRMYPVLAEWAVLIARLTRILAGVAFSNAIWILGLIYTTIGQLFAYLLAQRRLRAIDRHTPSPALLSTDQRLYLDQARIELNTTEDRRIANINIIAEFMASIPAWPGRMLAAWRGPRR